MSMPEGWPPTSKTPGQEHEDLAGNDSRGNYVAVHSLAILPAYQKRKLGRALMNVYVEYVKNQVSYATAIIIIAHNHLIPFYKSLGFKDQGPSECTFGGGGWFDMVSFILLELHILSSCINTRTGKQTEIDIMKF